MLVFIISSNQAAVSPEAVQFLLMTGGKPVICFLCFDEVKVLTGKKMSNKYRWHLAVLQCHALEMEEGSIRGKIPEQGNRQPVSTALVTSRYFLQYQSIAAI